jgi:hypothetical protein
MKMMCQKDFFMPGAVAVACILLGSAAWADTPLSLVVSENLTYDSNILRNNSNKYRDVISATGVQLGFNKQYGRQTYRASGTAVATRYKNSNFYDNDGYNLVLGFTSQVASNWFLNFDHNSISRLQSFQDQGLNRYKEPIKSQDTGLFVQYGLYGRWSLNADLGVTKIDYEVLRANNRSSKSAKLGVRYSPTDLLYFDFGYRRSNAQLPNYRSALISDDGEKIKQQSLDFSTRWVVTGYSNFDGRVSWNQERYAVDEQRDFNGLTGRIGWNYTPSGKIAYTVALDRDTNNSGGTTTIDGFSFADQTFVLGFNSQRRVSTGLLLRATYTATAKISLTASGNYRRIEEERRSVSQTVGGAGGGSVSGAQSTGTYTALSIGANYQLFRSTRLGCSLEKYDRSASLFSRDFSGDSVNCNAVFTLD